MDQEDRIYPSKGISEQHYYGNHGNIIHSNHADETQSIKYFKVFKKYRFTDHFLTLLIFMGRTVSQRMESWKGKLSLRSYSIQI